MSTEPKWLTDERAQIIAKHPELTGIRNFPIGTLRSAAQSIEASKASSAPLPRPTASKKPAHAPSATSAELVAQAQVLMAEVAALTAAKAARVPTEPTMATGESQSDYLDRVMSVPGTRFGADAVRTTVDSGPVQRFGVKVARKGGR
jgi:hypothetical protein